MKPKQRHIILSAIVAFAFATATQAEDAATSRKLIKPSTTTIQVAPSVISDVPVLKPTNNGSSKGIIDGKSVYKPQGLTPTGVNNSCLGDCNFMINGTNFPTYGTGKAIQVRSPKIQKSGQPPTLRLFFTMESKRIDLPVQVQQDGLLTAVIPENQYYFNQKVELELIIGQETLRNTNGTYKAEIVDVSDEIAREGIDFERCEESCLTWPVKNFEDGYHFSIPSSGLIQVSKTISTNDDVGQYWSNNHKLRYAFFMKGLKPQFEAVESTLINVDIHSCESNSDIWVYAGDTSYNTGLNLSTKSSVAKISPDVVHCRSNKGFDGSLALRTHTVTANMRFVLRLRGPKGIYPWQ
jgi:hypothetical protein